MFRIKPLTEKLPGEDINQIKALYAQLHLKLATLMHEAVRDFITQNSVSRQQVKSLRAA